MASAQTCNFDDRSLSKMTQREIDVDLCVDNQENEETRAGCDNENKDFDESRFKRDQFSNNATTHSIPVSAATNSKQSDDTCKEQAFEEDTRQKNQVRDSEQKVFHLTKKQQECLVYDIKKLKNTSVVFPVCLIGSSFTFRLLFWWCRYQHAGPEIQTPRFVFRMRPTIFSCFINSI